MSIPAARLAQVQAVVMGASAGGIEALGQLLGALRAGQRSSFLVVQHLPRERRSLLVEILAAKCALRVCEAEDKQPVPAAAVVFAPPDYHLLVDHAPGQGPTLALSYDELLHFSRPSIDVLFESAADRYAERLLAVLLTGANEDGAAGMQAVRRAGGLAVVQDPQEAYMPTMPEAALRAGTVDAVMNLRAIAQWLATLP